MADLTVREIVKSWLEENEYDGLCGEEECGCLTSDLMPCYNYTGECAPGYIGPSAVPDCDYGWAIYPSKDAAAKAKEGIWREGEDG